MDEFFNFEDAAHEPQLRIGDPNELDFTQLSSGGLYDVDLAFAEPENDENSFTCLQHFTAPEEELSFCLQNGMDTTMMGPDDFTDFPRWIHGMDVPTRPCGYCRLMRIHCKIIREGHLRGSCTSCIALHRTCSFMPGEGGAMGKRKGFKSSLVEGVSDSTGECVTPGEPISHRSSGDWSLNEEFTDEMSSALPHNKSAPSLMLMKASEENLNLEDGDNNPKVGARFSRESLRFLRDWLSTHHRHPYPTDDEKESLKRQTGLNKTQITNWLANARRRGKVRAPRSTSPSVHSNYANAMEIPRRATPAMEQMTPLDRWKHSPPENEPASITAISKAVTSSTFSSGRDSPYSYADDGSNQSLYNVSSTSSLGTSHSSGGSFASAYSHKSRGSFGSFGSFGNRGRRRRRRQAPKAVQLPVSGQTVRTFQCTFCTETFKTKHDWQRHEKSLHLSLERWVCSPDGPSQFCSATYNNRCVFCGLANPPAKHAEEHNYSSCADRSLEERTFYRKDHLRQHLNLIHDVKFQAFSMETWKVATPEIRSRCGFCGIIMDTWSVRVDHLAEHFKGGNSMADWKGDWGFDSQVLDIVENGMPPYLIHDERNSMNPYEATKEIAQPEKTLEDWIKIGLVEYVHNCTDSGTTPTDDDLLFEARRILRKAGERSSWTFPKSCWFNDLLMLSGTHPELLVTQSQETSWAQRLEKLAAKVASNKESDASICWKQRTLNNFVYAKQNLGLTPTNSELQERACQIMDEAENQSSYKSQVAVEWFKYLIMASTDWLEEFRRTVGLPRSVELAFEDIRSTDNTTIDYSVHNNARLEMELVEFVSTQRAAGVVPNDADLQRQARLIIYGNDDPWNQTLADDPEKLLSFKRSNDLAPRGATAPLEKQTDEHTQPVFQSSRSPRTLHWDLNYSGKIPTSNGSNGYGSGPGASTSPAIELPLNEAPMNQPSANSNPVQPLKFFLNDAQCYGRLVRELNRYVKTLMSPNNPNRHIPSDAEIQHQARVIIYDDDDPWNQTAADNAEWLIRFKRDIGLIPAENGPGLDITNNASWRYEKGGTGFSPPYVCPKEPRGEFTEDLRIQMDDREFEVKAQTAAHWLKTLGTRYQRPALVFCSRELESGLNAFVESEMAKGLIPSDDALRAKGRDILGQEETPVNDFDLLNKFKAMHGISPAMQPLSNDEMLAQFDKEMQGFNFSDPTVFRMPTTTEMDHTSFTAPAIGISTSGGATFNQQQQTQFQGNNVGEQQEYAEMQGVNATISSPLSGRANEELAKEAGIEAAILQPTSELPVAVAVAAKEQVHRLQGSGEISVHEWERWSQILEEA